MSMMTAGPTGMSMGNRMTGGGDKVPKGYKMGQIQQFTPEQMQLFQQMFGHVGSDSYLSKLARGDEGMFNQIEAPAFRQFQGLQGQVASRYSGQGMGARRSSGFQNEMGERASNFAQQLQAQRMGLQRQALQDLSGLSNQLLSQQPYQRFLIEKQQRQGGWGGLLGAGLGAVGGFFAGGPGGALAGGSLGYNIGSGF